MPKKRKSRTHDEKQLDNQRQRRDRRCTLNGRKEAYSRNE